MPGAQEAMVGLRREGVVQSLATGNLRSIAKTKLQAFGLVDGLDLEVGGYGSDGGVRSELVRVGTRAHRDGQVRGDDRSPGIASW